MVLRTFFSILLCVGLSFLGLAQSTQRSYISAKNFKLTDAEKQVVPYDIATDSNGFVYFSGPQGTHRFDGNNLVPIHNKKLLYQYFFKDELERLWVYNRAELRLFMVTSDSLIPYQYNHLTTAYQGYSVHSIYLDKQGTLYLALRGQGYLTISPEGELTKRMTPECGLHGLVITALKNGRLFCYSVHQSDNPEQHSSFKVYYQHQDQSIVEVTETGESKYLHPPSLIQHDKDNWTLSTGLKCLIAGKKDSLLTKTHFPFQVIKLFEDSDNNLWAGTYNKGIHRLKRDDLRSVEHLFGNEAASVRCNDSQGGMWATSSLKGFSFFPNPAMLRYSLNPTKYVPFLIGSLFSGQDQLYCNSSIGMVSFGGDSTYPLPLPKDIPDQENWTPGNIPTAYYVDTLNHQFCVASINHLGIWKDHHWQLHSLKNEAIQGYKMIGMFATGKDQLIGISTIEVIHITAGEVHSVIPLPKLARKITSVAVSSEGEIFLGTIKGIWQVKNDNIIPLSLREKALQETPIMHLSWLHNRLWVQTRDDGFFIIQGDKVEPLTHSDGSALNLDKCFVSDDGEIWSRLRQKHSSLVRLQVRNDSVVMHNYMFDDLAFQYPFHRNQLVVKNGTIYLGVKGGLFQTPINKLVKEGPTPKAYIQHVTANYEALPNQSSHILPFEKNSIALEFDAVSFRLKPVEFRCRLVGFDSTWIQPPFKGLQYTNLAPGKYRFQVQGRVANESWGPLEEMDFQVMTPIWQTWWFRALIGLAIVLFIGGIFLLWHRNQQRRAALVIDTLKAEQNALRAQMNPHFVYNALNSAQNFLLLGNTSDYNLFMSRLGELMRLGLEHSRLAFIPLDHEIRFLENYLNIEAQRFPNRFSYRFDIQDELKELSDVISLPPLMIQPLCENSIKHAYNGSPVEIVVSYRLNGEDALMVLVNDDGVGFTVEKTTDRRQSLGLNILRSRIELLKKQGFEASYNINHLDTVRKKGTSVSLKLPLK